MRRENLFSRSFAQWLRLMPGLRLSRFISILCHMMAAAPLLLLLYPPLEMLALLSVPIYELLLPVLRYNHAAMLMEVHEAEIYLPLRLVSGEGYGKKLLHAVCGQLMLLVSLLPLMGCIGYAMGLYFGSTDSFTVLRQLSGIIENGDWMDGLLNRFGVLMASLVPYFAMRALVSWRPFGFAAGARRGFMRGNRLRLIGVWLVSLVAYVPFIAVTAVAVVMYASSCTGSLIRLLLDGGTLPSPAALLITAAAAAVLSQPLCMLRQVLLSTFIHDIATKGESAHDAA